MTARRTAPGPAPRLGAATLAALPGDVQVPSYDRSRLVPSVVHIGVGGFHRAHQALYLDDLAELGETGWGVVGVGLHRPQMGEVLHAQDGLFTVVERSAAGSRARVVGSVVQYLYAPPDPEAVLRRLADPRTRLVTLTVTAAGYPVDGGRFRADDPAVRHDLAHPDRPRTVPGFLAAALDRRRRAGTGPFTVLSCDNLPDSGAAARTAVLGFAAHRDPALADWTAQHVRFPSSMVDRITPETSLAERDAVERTHGVADRWPVVAEPFRQWVVEDDFCAGRPPLERVGVQLVDDVAPYKLVKARLLNGGHSALGYLGTLAGHTGTAGAMADPLLHRFLSALLKEEVAPLLPPVAGLDLDTYRRTTLERFANPAVGDTLARLCRRGSQKVPAYLLPSLREARAQGRPHALLVLAVAGWLRCLRGVGPAGSAAPEVDDPLADVLVPLAQAGDLRALLGVREVFDDLADDALLVQELSAALSALERAGARAALGAALTRPARAEAA